MSFISDADHVLGEEMYNNTRGNPNIAFTRNVTVRRPRMECIQMCCGSRESLHRRPRFSLLLMKTLRHLDHAKLRMLLPTASEVETIEYKRRLNTLAARKSRERKLEDVQALSTLIIIV
ncbi:hypothetical protein B0H11DRAFT_2233337 [Mycena galericulata]|nr:hypothetical protein B0H11DRAFT_2233337 [Mycena galericulata]